MAASLVMKYYLRGALRVLSILKNRILGSNLDTTLMKNWKKSVFPRIIDDLGGLRDLSPRIFPGGTRGKAETEGNCSFARWSHSCRLAG
jgi:hypothetical protein